MSRLHTVNKVGQPLECCLKALLADDAILLIEDGVYALLEASDILADVIQDHPCLLSGTRQPRTEGSRYLTS